jgi:hypothetical protein
MQRLSTLTTAIGTVTAITFVVPVSAQTAPFSQSPLLAVPSAIAAPETITPIESVDKPIPVVAQQIPAATISMPPPAQPAQVWTIETTEQSLPTQTLDATVTATKPIWAESSTLPNASVATAELPLTQEITPIAPIPVDPAIDAAVTAQLPPEAEAAALQDAIENYQPTPTRWLKPYKASPGITLAIPSGFGADRGKMFLGVGVQRTRINTNDGAGGVGIGLGNAQTGIGVQLSYTSYSISPGKLFSGLRGIVASDRPFGAGGFNLKIHKRFPDGLSIALGADSIVNIGPRTGGVSLNSVDGTVQNELEGTYYAVATKLFQLKPDATEPFSRLAVTVGAGTGRFQPERTVLERRSVITPFASAALKISPAASFIAEWTGQDFGVGLSWVPFRNLPIVITPGFRDLFGPDATKPRFILGFGLSL